MTEREALKLALEALEIGLPLIEDFGSTEQLNAQHKAITAIYEALAQPEQEPVAWMDIDEKGFGYGLRYWSEPDNRHEVPLYTTPPQRTWVSLTVAEIALINADYPHPQGFAMALDAKLKEKNT